MKFKLFTSPAFLAVVVSFSGVLAFRFESPRTLSPVPTDEVISAHGDTRLGPKLTPIEAALRNPRYFKPLPPEQIDTETLWLARVIFSETKRANEQALVAWVVRNRVDTRYRGKRTYQSVILDPYQFSAFRPGAQDGVYYTGLSLQSKVPGWQTALKIAHAVRTTDSDNRPFSDQTRHFYSQRSMGAISVPAWARGLDPVEIGYDMQVDERRFRFFEDIS